MVVVANTLPIGLNRISWKHFPLQPENWVQRKTLPIGLNRISWKQLGANKMEEAIIKNFPTDWVKSD